MRVENGSQGDPDQPPFIDRRIPGEPLEGFQEEYQFLEQLYATLRDDPRVDHRNVGFESIDVFNHSASESFSLSKEDVCEEAGGGSCMVLINNNFGSVPELDLSMHAEILHLHSSGTIVEDRSGFAGLSLTEKDPDGRSMGVLATLNMGRMLDNVARLLSQRGITVDPPRKS